MIRRLAVFVYGVVSYAAFFGVFIYHLAWVAGLWVPVMLDSAPTAPLAQALLVDLALVALFGVQHTVMARPRFKRWISGIIPPEAERSTFVLTASALLALMMWQWQPIGGVLWNVGNPTARLALYGLCIVGWNIVLLSSFFINHFDLFGLRQVWLALRGQPYTPLRFKTPAAYSMVRHPMYVGILLAYWVTPTMTAAHLTFAVMMTGYLMVGIRYEERGLVVEHGKAYADYRRRVPMLVPFLRPRPSAGGDVPKVGEVPVS
jgi:protein-S-isoprenylcysteine O-methyltransferase Ste14